MTWILQIFLISASIFVANGYESNLMNIEPSASIAPTPKRYRSPLGVVPLRTSCGGPGQVFDWRYESCSSQPSRRNCQVPSDGQLRQSEITFIPSKNIPGGLYVRFNASAEGVPPMIYNLPLSNSAVRGGKLYTVRSRGGPTKEFQGKTMTFQYIIVRQADNRVEACAQADYDNV